MQLLGSIRFHLGFIFISVLVIATGLYIYRFPVQQMEQGKWVGHTREVMSRIEILSRHVSDLEAEQRGYLLTGEEPYLAPYRAASNNVTDDIASIESLTMDNPRQQSRIPALLEGISVTEAGLDRNIDARRTGHAPVLYEAAVNGSRQNIGAIQQQLENMKSEEQSLLVERQVLWQKASDRSRYFFLGGIFLLYALINAVYIFIHRETKSRARLVEAERAAAQAQQEESKRLAEIINIQHAVARQRLNFESAMQVITERSLSVTHADAAVVEMLEGDEMVYKAVSGTMAPHLGLRLKAQGSLSGMCVREASVLVCTDSETDNRVDKEACRKMGLRSMVVTPLSYHGNTVGVLKVTSARRDAFTDKEVATLQMMSGVLSFTLSDARAADAMQLANAQLAEANGKLEVQQNVLKNANILLEQIASSDGLTGLKNHQSFQQRLGEEFQRARRYKGEISVALIDVDRFKQFNDSFGHPAGDAVLKEVAALLQQTARLTDYVARYGGEEFAIVLPETDAAGALSMAERFREAIGGATWEKRLITVSVGVSTLTTATRDAATLLEEADKALYQSKKAGRDRVTAAT